ncbi:MAG: hypothetical protein ACR2FX_02820 [Chthoniobacterales bacterium]
MKRGFQALVECAPISDSRNADRRMRTAISRAKRSDHFSQQQGFDRAVAKLVRSTRVPKEIKEWFANEPMAQGARRNWKTTVFHPAVWAIVIALGVIGFISWLKFDEQIHTWAGESTAKKLLAVASATRPSQFEPVDTEAGTLGDLFLMKHRLEHYDVPPEFAHVRTMGARVFDDEEAGRVAHIGAAEKRMQFFLFPAQRDAKTGQPEEFEGWRYVEQEGWTGAVRARQGVLFMAAVRGPKKELARYVKE